MIMGTRGRRLGERLRSPTRFHPHDGYDDTMESRSSHRERVRVSSSSSVPYQYAISGPASHRRP